jgi:hypothetical protein
LPPDSQQQQQQPQQQPPHPSNVSSKRSSPIDLTDERNILKQPRMEEPTLLACLACTFVNDVSKSKRCAMCSSPLLAVVASNINPTPVIFGTENDDDKHQQYQQQQQQQIHQVSCHSCSFLNDPTRTRCEMCNSLLSSHSTEIDYSFNGGDSNGKRKSNGKNKDKMSHSDGDGADNDGDDDESANRCPICDATFDDADVASEHLNLHQSIEAEEFKRLRQRFGFEASNNGSFDYVSQYEFALIRDQQRNKNRISALELSTERQRLDYIRKSELDPGAVSGIIGALQKCYLHMRGMQFKYLCDDTDFFGSDRGDAGWGCGYRNIQMLCSFLMHSGLLPSEMQLFDSIGASTTTTTTTTTSSINNTIESTSTLSAPLSSTSMLSTMPSIPAIQRWIERAWQVGFDREGAGQLGNKLCGTKKYIGATECVALLRSFGVR